LQYMCETYATSRSKRVQHTSKTVKHFQQTLATCLWNTCSISICNISIYFCNIHMKHLKHTSETSETLETFMGAQKCTALSVAPRGPAGQKCTASSMETRSRTLIVEWLHTDTSHRPSPIQEWQGGLQQYASNVSPSYVLLPGTVFL